MKKLLMFFTVLCVLIVSAMTLCACGDNSATEKTSNDGGNSGRVFHWSRFTLDDIYSNDDGNYTFLQMKLQNIGDMVTVTSVGGNYNYLLVDFKVLKDYRGKLLENSIITIPVSLAVLNNEESLAQIVEYYNSNSVSTSQANKGRMYGKRYATSQDIPATSVGNPPTQTKENVNIDIEKVERFLKENDSFVVYVHLLIGKTTQQLTTTDETKKVDALTDVRLFNNKNFYAVKNDAVTQKQVKELCTEFGGLIGMEVYDDYDKFFYENIAFADFDKNIVEFLNKQSK